MGRNGFRGMRFCLITTFFPPYHFGGDAVFVAKLANLLVGAGHEVEVVHCRDSFSLLSSGVAPSAVPVDSRVVVHTLESPLGALSPALTYITGQPWLKTSSLRRILAREFDVVHWHNLSLVGGPGALRLPRAAQLCTLHEYWFICPTHILFRNNEEACTRRTCFTCTLRQKRIPQPWRASKYLKRAIAPVDRFLAPSRFVQKLMRESPLRLETTVLPHFVEGPELPRARPREYFLYVGRLEKAKGVQTVLPLFADGKRRLRIAGAGNHEGELRRQAAGSAGIEFLGRVPHEQLGELYAGAIATIVPSICYETFGLVALESFRYGTPVIASSFGALPEIVSDTGGGLVYRDLEQLAQALDRFTAEPGLSREYGEAGRARLPNYSPEEHLRRYLEIVREIVT